MKSQQRENWGSKIGFIMAAAGSAIGLGNIWRFPYIAGENGGGAFVLVYLVCICLIGIPVMIAELAIGRSTQQNPIGAFEKLEGKKTLWMIPGFLGVFAAIIILSYYSVVAGWVLDYVGKSVTGQFSAGQDPEKIQSMLNTLLGNGEWQVFMHFIFMCLTTFIVMSGVCKGIEKASKILMPALFVLLIGLFSYSFTQPGSSRAWEFLFYPDFSKLSGQGILAALGQAFFTLSLGMGAMITYGSYMKRDQSILRSAFIIGTLDTLIALIGGIIIFSIGFSFQNFQPAGGPTLVFSTLPALFVQLPAGSIISTAFFVLLAFAALTSAIAIMEIVVSYLVDTLSWSRKTTAICIGSLVFILGILSAFSYNHINIKLPVKAFFGKDMEILDSLDALANILLPLGALLTSIFVGWKMSKKTFAAEFAGKERKLLTPILAILKFLAPVLIAIMLLNSFAFIQSFFAKLTLLFG